MDDLEALKSLLPAVVAAVEAAGQTLTARFQPDARPADAATLLKAVAANDAAVTDDLRAALLAARPGSGWLEDEDERGEPPAGEWWVADAAEGNVNHVHGGSGWGVTTTLVCDGDPVLAAIVLPVSCAIYTAIRGGGAFANGKALNVSRKTQLGSSIMGTGQARPGEDAETHAYIGRSVTAMLGAALLVRMSVPSTLELVDVAAGRMDGFWQHSQVRSGLAAGALLVREAGGKVTDSHGRPWTFASQDFLATAPGVHEAVVATLSGVNQTGCDRRVA